MSLYQVYIKSCLTLLILGPQKTTSQLTQLTAKLKNVVKRKGDGDARSEKCRKWVRHEQKKLAVKKAHPYNGSFSTRLLSTLRLLGSSCWQKLGPVQDIFSLPNFSKSQTDLEKEKAHLSFQDLNHSCLVMSSYHWFKKRLMSYCIF